MGWSPLICGLSTPRLLLQLSPVIFAYNPTAMASPAQALFNRTIISHHRVEPKANFHQAELIVVPNSIPISRRRTAIIISTLAPLSFSIVSFPQTAVARERRNRKNIPTEDYLTGPDGIQYYDVVEGRGRVAEKGSTVQVHFDCIYRSITAVSSRESKLLAGNRSIAQPYEFMVGSTPGKERKRDFADNANGLFSAQAAPKPPPALYKLTEGMKVGGKRTVIVPPDAGYGNKGRNEIPPGATFQLNIELLQVAPPEGK